MTLTFLAKSIPSKHNFLKFKTEERIKIGHSEDTIFRNEHYNKCKIYLLLSELARLSQLGVSYKGVVGKTSFSLYLFLYFALKMENDLCYHFHIGLFSNTKNPLILTNNLLLLQTIIPSFVC